MAENTRELIEQGRREVAEDRRIAGMMIQDENRQAMKHRADVTERLCDELDTATAQVEALQALADRWETRGRSEIEMADSSSDDFDSLRDEGYAFISRALHIRSVLEETSTGHPAPGTDGQESSAPVGFPGTALFAELQSPVSTGEARDALPAGVIVRSAQGSVACRHHSGMGVVFGDERPFPWDSLALPLTVLYTPEDSHPAVGELA